MNYLGSVRRSTCISRLCTKGRVTRPFPTIGPVQLDELSINEFHFNHYFRGTSGSFARSGVIRSLKRFMRQQRKMRALDLSFNSMTEEEGVTLLTSIASTRSSDKLESLNIEELFKGKERVFECRAFIDAMTQFSNLSVLVMNYNCLSDNLLCAMADSVHSIGQLKQLDIRFTRSDINDHVIHPTSWFSFKHAFPYLRVYFRAHSWIKLNDIQKALVSEIPLTTLVLLGHNDDSFQPDRTLRHVARHYRSVLEKFVIEINPSYRSYHRSLVTIFKDCTKLQSLELRGRVEWPTLREIFEHLDEEYFKKGRRPSINYFRMTVVAQTHDSYAQEALIFEEYREALQRYDLDYQLIVEPQFFPLPLEYNHDQPFVYEAGNEPIDVELL
ncbi:F-box only protein 39 [Holothuria leucospilota]|uniref:F-box only protein 39 n=1 Tax=Holothuria leucospilota TaxID=206669 RepID=A0A9Q1HGF1_HOLLE|nr:F-box only protein 39 [Holothuria leucospilota]